MNEIITQKRCTKCGEVKSLEKFNKEKRMKDGKTSQCKECQYKLHRSWVERNIDSVAEYAKQYRVGRLEEERDAGRRWREAHPEKKKEVAKRWRDNNPEQAREIARKYRTAFPEKANLRTINRRAQIRYNGGQITEKEWIDLKEKYGNKCLCCNRTDVKLELDHVLPVKLGGKNIIENAQPLCRSCNAKKSAHHIDYRPK